MRLGVLVSLVALFSASAARADSNAVAVLDIQGTGVAPELLPTLTEILTAELAAMRRYKVIAGRDIQSMLGFEKQKDVLGCTDAACLAEIGGALGVDRIVASHIGVVGSTYVVNIKLINIRMADTEARVYETVRGEQDALIDVIKKSVLKLFGQVAAAQPPKSTASESKPPPKAAETEKQPEAEPEQVAQAEPEPSVEESAPGKPLPVGPIALWGVAGAGVVVGTIFGMSARSNEAEGEKLEAGSQAAVERAHKAALRANISFGVGAAAGIAGLVWFFVGGDGGSTALLPVVGPDGAGLAVGGRF